MTLRSGIIENYTKNDISSIGVRVIKNKKQISILFQDKNEYKKHLQDAITAVQLQKEDEFAKIPKPSEIEQPDPNIDIDCFDGTNLTKDKMHKICMEANEGLFSEKGITNSEGITVSNTQSERCFVSSNGFYDCKKTSCYSCFVSAIATNDSDGSMENDYEYDANVFIQK